MSAATSWFYQKSGQELGPVSSSDLKRLAASGELLATDVVRTESRLQWTAASNVKGLFPEVVELEIADDVAPNTAAMLAPPSLPSPLPVSNLGSVPNVTPPVVGVLRPTTTSSASIVALRQVVSDTVWNNLVRSKLPVDADLFWIRLHSLRTRKTDSPPRGEEAKGFWKKASETLASFAETVDIQTNRYFITTPDGRVWITNQLGAVGDVWSLDPSELTYQSTWSSTVITVSVRSTSPASTVEQATIQIDLAAPFQTRSFGSPNILFARSLVSSERLPVETWAPFPLVLDTSESRSDSFFHPLEAKPQACIVGIDGDGILWGHGNQTQGTKWSRIHSYRSAPGELTWLEDTGDGLRLQRFATSLTHKYVDEAESFLVQSQAIQEHADGNVEDGEAPLNHTDSSLDAVVAVDDKGETSTDADATLSMRSLSDLVRSLWLHRGDFECKDQMLGISFSAKPLFGASSKRIALFCQDAKTVCYVANLSECFEQPSQSYRIESLGRRYFITINDSDRFEVCVDDRNESILKHFVDARETPSIENASTGCLVLVTAKDHHDIETATPCLLFKENRGDIRIEASENGRDVSSFRSHVSRIEKKSLAWNAEFGVVAIADTDNSQSMRIITPIKTLIRLWESRELSGLSERTQGISLGEMYKQYNEMRTQKFVTGVFGNYFVAQQRLELRSSLDDVVQRIEQSPSGTLPEELELELIERLSVLEISRNQLNRWLDRCTLMFPHQQAAITGRWLDEAFGPRWVSAEVREQETWRVHHQMRGELRQVQSSMNRAMAEVGQNLNAIAFAFPEEVRCAALAATRRAASLAGNGAMVAAFAGMGGQLLMGLGRASIGDPMGIALLGTVGMSMVGRHLEKNAKETEKKIRIRAYGLQAIQWWKVVLETAAITAVECRHANEQMQAAAMKRDRKLLEAMPREELVKAQQRMASVMRTMLHEEVGNQFYEALPGSGVFGWHIVDYMNEMTHSRPKRVIDTFSGEVPGSLAKKG